MPDSEPYDSLPDPRRCLLCGREGTRGFTPAVKPGAWVCRFDAACERRVRGTGQVGVGVMRTYAR